MFIRNAMALLLGLLSLTMPPNSRDEDKTIPTLEFSIGQVASKDTTNVLDVGPVGENTSADFEINVRNLSPKAITLDSFAMGSNLNSEWEVPELKTGLKTRAMIDKNSSTKLRLAVQFVGSSSARIDFMVQGRRIATLLVVYQIMPPLYCKGIQNIFLPSAYGSGRYPPENSPYSFCTLPAVPGYE
jgi:hypothetical protein